MSLVEEIADRGVAAVVEEAGWADATLRELAGWLAGARLSARADEPELRVRAAQQARELFAGVGAFDRLAALAILALPPDHPERDRPLARRLLLGHLGADDDPDEDLRTIAALLDAELVGEHDALELLERGERLAEGPDEGGATELGIAARSWCMRRQIEAAEDGDEAAARRWLDRAVAFAPAAPDAGDEDLAAVASLAEELDVAQRWAEAADVYRRLVDATSLDDAAVQQLAIREGELRLMTGDPGGAAAALAQALPHVEARYLDALRDEDVADAARAHASLVDCLAVAQGQLGEWSAVCRTLDRLRGLRLRMQAALRGRPEGAELLALERRLQAALRGAPDAPPPAEALEAYRRLRPAATAEPAGPGGMELAASLEPDEAVAFVGHHFTGTVVSVALAGPEVAGFVRDDVTTADWILALGGDEEEAGWIEMLADPAAATPGAGLGRLVGAADAAVGERLRALLDARGVRRVTMLTEDILRLIPWWALPSLAGLHVTAAGSAADLLRERAAPPAPAPRTALVVANPTLDLPLTAVACAGVGASLERAGFDATALAGAAATEPAVLDGLRGRTILHFGGHGRSDVAYSALELQPDPPRADDPFPALLAEVESWREPEEEGDGEPWTHRWADLPGRGRLHERRWAASGRMDRRLEHQAGAIAATYRDGTCVRVGELWSAADLLVGDALHDCRLAVLTACESAVTGRGEDTRALGLPAGLAFAGVGCVVGSLWPVDEAVAALWTGAFYDALTAELAAGETTVDVAALVHDTSAAIRGLSRAEAAGRLGALARATADPVVRFMLEADAAGLAEQPFAAPHHWAAFHVTGRATVTFEEAP